MNQRNCPNCAAPYDVQLNKCPYCRTSYYDLSALNLSACEPFYLKIKTELNGAPCYITQLVRPRADISIEFGSELASAYDCFGNRVCTFTRNEELRTKRTWEAVTGPSARTLCTIEMGE